MNKFLFTVFSILVFATTLHAQEADQADFVSLEADLAFYADVMVNADKADHRLRAGDIFYKNFTELLDQDGSYDYAFDSLKWISRIQPSDGSFRIFSWQVRKADQTSKYFAILQKKKSKEHQLVFLRVF